MTIFDKSVEVDCLGCVDRTLLAAKELLIYEAKYWYVEQDIELAYPGMVILASKRHFSNFSDMNEQELAEFKELVSEVKLNLQKIFDVDKFAYMFFERIGGHFHFIIIPILAFMEIKDKSAILAEIIKRSDELKSDKENMKLVVSTIESLRKQFSKK